MAEWLPAISSLVVLGVAAIAVPAGLDALEKHFPPSTKSLKGVDREFTLIEQCISLSVLAVFLPGVIAAFAAIRWMGGGQLLWSNFFLYVGGLFGATYGVPLLIARLGGTRFYTSYVELSERRGGIGIRGLHVLAGVVVGTFVLCAAISRVVE